MKRIYAASIPAIAKLGKNRGFGKAGSDRCIVIEAAGSRVLVRECRPEILSLDQSDEIAIKRAINSGIADIEVEEKQAGKGEASIILTLRASGESVPEQCLALLFTNEHKPSRRFRPIPLPKQERGEETLFAHLIVVSKGEEETLWSLHPETPTLFHITSKGLERRGFVKDGEDKMIGQPIIAPAKPTEEKPAEEKPTKPAKKTKPVPPLKPYFKNGGAVESLKKAGIETVEGFLEAVKSPKAIKDLAQKTQLTQSALKNAKKAIQAEES